MNLNSSATKLISNLRLESKITLDLRRALPFLLGALVFAYSMSNMAGYVLSDPDTLMHITSGTWMLEHHLIPAVDPFSHNTDGLSWIAHEWLAQILMALSFEWSGFFGLRILVASLFSLAIVCQSLFLLNRIPAIYAIFLIALSFVSLLGHHLARPHIFTWPIVIIWLTILLNRLEKKQWRAPYILLPLMVLWANLHGSFILGLMMIPFFFIETLLSVTRTEKIKVIKSWVLFFLLAVISSLITPYGLDGIRFSVNMVSTQFTSTILEWKPASGYSLLPIEYWVILLLAMGLTGYLRLPVIRLLLLLGFIHESLAHVRFISILGLVTPLLIAKPFGDLYYANHKINSKAEKISQWGSNKKIDLGIILFTGLLYLFPIMLAKIYQQNSLNSSTAPEEAISFVKQVSPTGNVLNYYSMGGYLIYKKIPVFIDGRADLYGSEKLDEYFSIVNLENPSTLKKVLENHKIGWTIFPPNEKIVFFLNNQADWKMIYEDQDAVIHIKKESSD